MKPTDSRQSPMAPNDQALVDLIKDEYRPRPMTSAQKAAFRLRLAEKIERRTFVKWRAGLGIGVAAAAMLLLVMLRGTQPDGNDDASLSAAQETPLLYAYVDPDDYASDAARPGSFLPSDYLALADVLNVSEDEL